MHMCVRARACECLSCAVSVCYWSLNVHTYEIDTQICVKKQRLVELDSMPPKVVTFISLIFPTQTTSSMTCDLVCIFCLIVSDFKIRKCKVFKENKERMRHSRSPTVGKVEHATMIRCSSFRHILFWG